MQIKPIHIFAALLAIIVILSCVIIFRKSVTVVDSTSEIELLRADNLLRKKNTELLNLKIDSLRIEITNLGNIKTVIKHIYHEQIIKVNTASANQLDSTIRANW